MVEAVLASVASLSSPLPPPPDVPQKDKDSVVQSLQLLLDYRRLISATQKSIIPSEQKKTFESEHPYAHNLDTETHVSFPGASSIVIEFDSRCRSESSCDYLRFWQGDKQVGEDKYHGGSNGWPRTTIQGSSFRFTFHSDGSQNDWGYKFCATASCQPILHWADFKLTAELLQPVIEASIARLFTQGSLF